MESLRCKSVSGESLGSILSIGTAEAHRAQRPQVVECNTGSLWLRLPRQSCENERPFPLSARSSISPAQPRNTMEAPSRKSHDTMEGFRERPKTRGKSVEFARQAPESMLNGPPVLSEKRESIIDPASVRVSYTGDVSDIGRPARPLEEGLQALYNLYEE